MSSIKTQSTCMCLHHVEMCTYLYMVLAGSAGNVYSVIGGIYPGIICGLTQPCGMLEVRGGGGVYYRGLVVRIVSHMNGLHAASW